MPINFTYRLTQNNNIIDWLVSNLIHAENEAREHLCIGEVREKKLSLALIQLYYLDKYLQFFSYNVNDSKTKCHILYLYGINYNTYTWLLLLLLFVSVVNAYVFLSLSSFLLRSASKCVIHSVFVYVCARSSFFYFRLNYCRLNVN